MNNPSRNNKRWRQTNKRWRQTNKMKHNTRSVRPKSIKRVSRNKKVSSGGGGASHSSKRARFPLEFIKFLSRFGKTISDVNTSQDLIKFLETLNKKFEYIMVILGDGYCVIRSMFYNTLIKYPDHLYSLFDNYNITEATFNHFNNLLEYNGKLLYANYESFKNTKSQILSFISKFRGAKNYNIFEKLEPDDTYIMKFIKFLFTEKALNNATINNMIKKKLTGRDDEFLDDMRNLGNSDLYFPINYNNLLAYIIGVNAIVYFPNETLKTNFADFTMNTINSNLPPEFRREIVEGGREIDLLSLNGGHYEILLRKEEFDNINYNNSIKSNVNSGKIKCIIYNAPSRKNTTKNTTKNTIKNTAEIRDKNKLAVENNPAKSSGIVNFPLLYIQLDDKYINDTYTGNTENAIKIRNAYQYLKDSLKFSYICNVRGDNFCVLRTFFYAMLIKCPEVLREVISKSEIPVDNFNNLNEKLKFKGIKMYDGKEVDAYNKFNTDKNVILALIDSVVNNAHAGNLMNLMNFMLEYGYFDDIDSSTTKMYYSDLYIMNFIKMMLTYTIVSTDIIHDGSQINALYPGDALYGEISKIGNYNGLDVVLQPGAAYYLQINPTIYYINEYIVGDEDNPDFKSNYTSSDVLPPGKKTELETSFYKLDNICTLDGKHFNFLLTEDDYRKFNM
jgi:hypothetical protein